MKTFQVARFELVRNLKKPSFWIAALMVPLVLVGYVMIVGFTSYSAGEQLAAGSDTTDLKLGLCDEANYLHQYNFINSNGDEQSVAKIETRDDGLAAIKNNELDVFYYIGENFAETTSVEIHVKNGEAGLFDDYSAPIAALLGTEAQAQVQPINFAIIAGTITYETTNYDQDDNHIVDMNETISRMAAPIIAIVLFYIILVLLGNRLTVAMTEEKENRISELLLTSIKPIHLIAGKTISLMILGIIQVFIILIPAFVVYRIALNNELIPNFELNLTSESVAASAILLFCSYFMFTALSMLIGAISSTARDANSYAGVLMILMILPIIFLNAFSAETPSTLGYVLTYFPPSAPISLMLRNIFNNLPTHEMIIGIIEIFVFGTLVLYFAAYIFCRNAISFTSKIDFKKLLGAPRKQWKK
jgi:ABC-2 type transport system permease protein